MKLECLQRLSKKTSCLREMTGFLVQEKLINRTQEKTIYTNKNSQLIIREVHNLLTSLLDEEEVQLVDYMWNILPVEQIRITIVSDNEKREFTFGI